MLNGLRRHKQVLATVALTLMLILCLKITSHKLELNELQKLDCLLSPVPHIVHQSWKTKHLPTNRSVRWRATWKSCFPSWQMRLWTDEDNLALVRNHYPWFLPAYLSFRNPIERADVARYFYLFHYGGIYTDLDNVCMKSFAHLLNSSGLVFGGMAGGPKFDDPVLGTYVQNSFMASRPGHPFWMSLVNRIMFYQSNMSKAYLSSGRAEYLTGPYALMDEIKEYLKSGGSRQDLAIYPGSMFNPFSWGANTVPACRDLGRMTDAEETACLAAFPDAFVVQFHTQSWDSGRL